MTDDDVLVLADIVHSTLDCEHSLSTFQKFVCCGCGVTAHHSNCVTIPRSKEPRRRVYRRCGRNHTSPVTLHHPAVSPSLHRLTAWSVESGILLNWKGLGVSEEGSATGGKYGGCPGVKLRCVLNSLAVTGETALWVVCGQALRIYLPP